MTTTCLIGVIVGMMPPSDDSPPLLDPLALPELDPVDEAPPLLPPLLLLPLPPPLLPPLPLPPSLVSPSELVSALLPQAIGVSRNGAARRKGQARVRRMGAHCRHGAP